MSEARCVEVSWSGENWTLKGVGRQALQEVLGSLLAAEGLPGRPEPANATAATTARPRARRADTRTRKPTAEDQERASRLLHLLVSLGDRPVPTSSIVAGLGLSAPQAIKGFLNSLARTIPWKLEEVLVQCTVHGASGWKRGPRFDEAASRAPLPAVTK